MKKGRLIGGAAAAVLCAVVLFKIFNKEPFAEAIADPVVEVTTPHYGDIKLTTGVVGTVEPEEVIYIYPKASGDVIEVKVKAGEYVEAGQLLCVIDTRQVESAKSTLDSAELALSQAQDELSRQSVLYAGGGISQQEYKQYQDNVTSAQITYNEAKINYENQVSYSQVTAPISGVVEACNIETFDTVSESDLICVISGQSAKIVSFSVSERIRGYMREGDEITVEKDQEEFNGVIYEVSSMADTESGLFNVKARLDQEPDWETLPTGSKVKLYVTSESVENVMLVPVDSVYYDGGLSYVYTYNEEEGTLHKEQVETGLYDSQWIEIQSGLDETDIVLTTWSSELYEGTYVRTVESGNTADDETTAESGGTEAEEKEEELTETPEAEEQQ